MAEVSHGSGSAAARTSHTGDTNWTTVLTVSNAGLKVDNAKYLIKVVAKIHSDDNAFPLANFRMARGATPTELPRSWQKLEVGSSTDGNSNHYNWFHIFTQPATAEDILFQQKTDNSGNTVRTDDLHIFYMRLTGEGLTENTDWKVAVDTSGPTEHDGTMTSRVALTWTPATASHDWLILGNASVRIDTAADKYEFELFDSTGSAVLATHKREGEDIDEEQQQILVAVLANLPATEQVVQFRTRDTADVATQNFYKESELFCLDLDLFEVHAIQSLGTLAQVDNNPIEANNLEPTPLTAGDWFVIAGVRALTAGASGNRTRHRIQIAGVTDPVGFFDDPRYTQSFDAADEQYTTVVAMPNFAVSAQDIDIDVEWFDGTSQSWNDRVAVAFSMELLVAAADPELIPRYRQQVYHQDSSFREDQVFA